MQFEAMDFSYYCRLYHFFEEKMVIQFSYFDKTIVFYFCSKTSYSRFDCHSNEI